MLYQILALIILIILLFAIRKFRKIEEIKGKKEPNKEYKDNYKNNTNDKMPYRYKKILTNTEFEFYQTLNGITTEKGCLICPKVGLKDIADITEKENYMTYFYKISQKHVDFLICDKNLKTLFAIELDDPSHNNNKAKANDTFKNKFFKQIGVPLYRIKTGYYDVERIKDAIFYTDIKRE